MLQLRRSHERGMADHGWLKSRHTFSFADYHDPAHMGFRALRVINEDHIQGGTGFGAHPHRDMEIISYVVSGALQHQDSMGNKTVIRPGEVQTMSAGTGVVHSEHNPLPNEDTHLLQIWILPKARGGTPRYGQKSFEAELDSGRMTLVVSQDGRDGSIGIKQDADLYIARPRPNENLEFRVRPGRGAWVQVVQGRLMVNGTEVLAGDALAFEDEELLKIETASQSEFLLFDLA